MHLLYDQISIFPCQDGKKKKVSKNYPQIFEEKRDRELVFIEPLF